MEQLPGKKAFINDTIESVRGNLRGILAEMGRMSDAHEAGDIDVYINVDQFQGGFKTMAEGVNQMVGSHIAVKKRAMGVFKAFGEGDFDASMEQLPGKKVFINDTIESVRGNLRGIIAEMNTMSDAHEAGDIDIYIDAEKFNGGFKIMAAGVNKMVGSHIAVKKRAMAVVKAFGEGDFDEPMEKLPGKKAFINDDHRAGTRKPQDPHQRHGHAVQGRSRGPPRGPRRRRPPPGRIPRDRAGSQRHARRSDQPAQCTDRGREHAVAVGHCRRTRCSCRRQQALRRIPLGDRGRQQHAGRGYRPGERGQPRAAGDGVR